jgi:hypothetical protein
LETPPPRKISEALLPYLQPVLGGPDAWAGNATVRRTIEIRDGIIQNPRILSFQRRSPQYPHPHRFASAFLLAGIGAASRMVLLLQVGSVRVSRGPRLMTTLMACRAGAQTFALVA